MSVVVEALISLGVLIVRKQVGDEYSVSAHVLWDDTHLGKKTKAQ